MKCPNCHKKNNTESNFCVRCGTNLSKLQKKKCSICLENKKLETLGCGHQVCLDCLHQSYQIKKECPECRKDIQKCNSCHSYRVIKIKNGRYEKCLECGVSRKIKKNTVMPKYTCLECQSKRLLYNHVSDSWNCLDCFQNFKIDGDDIKIATNLISTTTICLSCCSNNIEMNIDGDTRCLHCLQDNVRTKVISLEEYSLLTIKSPEEVKPTSSKKCQECQGDKYFKMMDANGFDFTYYCYTCKKSNVVIS